MSEPYPSDQISAAAARAGRLRPHVPGYVEWLDRAGYAHATIRWKLCLVCVFGRWAEERDLCVRDFDETVVARHVRKRLDRGDQCHAVAGVLLRFLDYLRSAGATPTPESDAVLPDLVHRYRRFLEQERGLAAATIENYLGILRQFLAHRFGDSPQAPEELRPSDASDFLLEHAPRVSPGRASLMVTTLRSFCRFLLQHGEIADDLSASVPAIARRPRAPLPRSISPAEVERVIQACDRSTGAGIRDHAILLMLARLGLRAGEVVSLSLDDVDWRAGVLTVHGKGPSHDRLPLPRDVGEALVDYLQDVRPRGVATRRLFLRARAPLRGFASAAAVTTLVCRAIGRAGVQAPFRGAHLLRHSLATGMLAQGASLGEIGELLRHRSTTSTEIYARVDVEALRSLALPWPAPGGAK